MAQYSGSIDINMIADIKDKNIISMKNVYYKSTSTNINDIPDPVISNENIDKVINVSQGVVKVNSGAILFQMNESEWSYTKPQFEYGYHLWCSMEILVDDGTVIYSEPFISADWESYYNIDIGGTNLIRNSKTLIDERIYFE